MSEEKLKLRANNMLKEWFQDANESELMMSIDEVLATPDAGKTIVQTIIDYSMDCKISELKLIIDLIMALHRNKKVSSSDIEVAMADIVEFIDSFACDNPQVFHYVGEMFSVFVSEQILTFAWLCNCTSRVMGDDCKAKVIEEAMKSIKRTSGVGAIVSCFDLKGDRNALEQLFGPAKVQELSARMLPAAEA